MLKKELWQKLEPHVRTYLEDPGLFSSKSPFFDDLDSGHIRTLQRIILRVLDNKNENFADSRFDFEDHDDEIMAFRFYWDEEDIAEFIQNDTLLKRHRNHPMTRREVRDQIVASMYALFNGLHDESEEGREDASNHPASHWLKVHGYNFAFVDIKKEKRERHKDDMDGGYMYMTFYMA